MDILPLLHCPTCHGDLAERPDALVCVACDRSYEVVHGIPDFRPAPPDRPRHGPMCRMLMDRWPTSTYRELWDAFNGGEGPSELGDLWRAHEELAPQRGHRRWQEIRRAAAAMGRPMPSDGVALDLGCGGGSALFALAEHSRLAVGVDVALSELLLAKKRLAEAGVDPVALACADATQLPLRTASVDIINATDVVEHVPDPERFLREARRVLRPPSGVFFFNSPNRFSLLAREPHVGLWGVGFLPRSWTEPYVRWRLGRTYQGKRLLSYFELRRLLGRTFGSARAIWTLVPGRGVANAIGRALGAIGKPLVPEHNVLAWLDGAPE